MENKTPELPVEIWERIYRYAHLLFARKFMLRSKIKRKTETTRKDMDDFGHWKLSECNCWTGIIYPSYSGPCECCKLDLGEAKRLLEEWSK